VSVYHYLAINETGQEKKRRSRSGNRKACASIVACTIAHSRSSTCNTSKKIKLSRSHQLSSKEIAQFTRQFATMLSAGLPVEEALLAVSEQTEKSHFKALILAIRGKVLEGHSLAAALRDHPQSFSGLFIATISAGERSGHLDKVLLRLADYTEQQSQLQQKIKTALIYPTMIILIACGIVGFLLAYVVPKMVGVYAHLNQTLPWLTTLLISISHVVRSLGGYILLVMIVGLYGWRSMLMKNTALRTTFHFSLLRLPLIGSAIRSTNTARFSRTLSILSASGVPIIEAMQISAQLISSIPIRHAVETAVHRVREGATIHASLKQTTYFSPMSVHMMASGEASGTLESMLERVALHQENDMSRFIEVGLALFEPAIILIMGVIVLFIVLAVLLPIFDMNDFVG